MTKTIFFESKLNLGFENLNNFNLYDLEKYNIEIKRKNRD